MIDVDNRTIDPNHFANALLAPLALALVGLLRARKPGPLLAYGAAVLVIAAGQIISLSREALLGSVLSGRADPVLEAARARSGDRHPGRRAGRADRAGDRPAHGRSGHDRRRRAQLHLAHRVARDRRRTRCSAGASGGAIEAYDRNYLAVYALVHQSWGRPPHNTPLHIMLELGVVGLVLGGLAFVTTFRQFAGIRRGDGLYDLRVALTAALVALASCRCSSTWPTTSTCGSC